MIDPKRRQRMRSNIVTIRLGCETKEEVYRSSSLGTITVPQRRTWTEKIAIPENGYNRVSLICPICNSCFGLKVYSKTRARLRKFYFASCFFAIAGCGILFGILADNSKGLMGYSIAAPFTIFTVWQLSNGIRRRFDASDLVSHAGGKIHRIYDEKKVIFPN
jgi:hypothetical protein